MAKPPRPRGFKVGRRPTAAFRKDHGGGGVRQPPRGHGPARAHLPPVSASSAAAPEPGLLSGTSAPPTSPAAPAPGVPPPDCVPWYMAPASWYMTHERAHVPPTTTPTAAPPAPVLLPPATTPTATPPAPGLLPPASAPSSMAPAPALLLPPTTAPSTATPEPWNYNGMLLGPRVHARDLSLATAPATSVATALSLPPTANSFSPRLSAHGLPPVTESTTTDPPPALCPLPTASSIYNPMVADRRNLGLLDSLDLELIDGETEAAEHSMHEEDEWDLKAAWCSGA